MKNLSDVLNENKKEAIAMMRAAGKTEISFDSEENSLEVYVILCPNGEDMIDCLVNKVTLDDDDMLNLEVEDSCGGTLNVTTGDACSYSEQDVYEGIYEILTH